MLYQAYQAQADLLWPGRTWAKALAPWLAGLPPDSPTFRMFSRTAAALELFSLAEITHTRPDFGIRSVISGGHEIPVTEEIAHATPFATLLRFRKDTPAPQPRVLVVAPMSGHFATLLRETVRTLLGDHDVYITDWHNARDVPLAAGRFGLDEYIEHMMDFLGVMGPGAHVVAVCQPCVAALAATALMAEDDNPATPLSLTLMAGPIDCRVNPTAVNTLATSKPIDWFEKNLIATVPMRYAGGFRRVYPGFVQLMAFMNMNLERHVNSFREYHDQIAAGEAEKARAKRTFYAEYLAVADLPSEFYLETVERVFQTYDLARGALEWRGRRVNPAAIRRTALLTVEGENDDICALGQTLAAQDLCTSVRQFMRTHYVQTGVGHYGVFSGGRWNNFIYPVVREVIQVSEVSRARLRLVKG
jgi:poly(3-hydroxybutyrate) depolymerase